MNIDDFNLSKSQASQDMFVYFISGKDDGYFLDIGCSHPENINNTHFLEKKGWKGLCIDRENLSDIWKKERVSKFIQTDLLKTSINDIMKNNNCPTIIDYISFDVDAASIQVFNNFDFHKYKFKIMTFEHDLWNGGANLRILSRKILSKFGYVMLCEDIGNGGDIDRLVNPYEDWWINPEYIDVEKYEFLKCSSRDWHYPISKIKEVLLLNQ